MQCACIGWGWGCGCNGTQSLNQPSDSDMHCKLYGSGANEHNTRRIGHNRASAGASADTAMSILLFRLCLLSAACHSSVCSGNIFLLLCVALAFPPIASKLVTLFALSAYRIISEIARVKSSIAIALTFATTQGIFGRSDLMNAARFSGEWELEQTTVFTARSCWVLKTISQSNQYLSKFHSHSQVCLLHLKHTEYSIV